ncbi:MAG: tRNA glutamyl-Q(34) synthetase GluQRS [Pseudomonadota bacterium]
MITRFAPSPTGPLHLGHAYSACLAHDAAKAAKGTFLLRIEDIDQSRVRPDWEAQIFDDLAWLGLEWPRPIMRQSQRLPAYHAALQKLWDADLLYPCSCNRRDIREAATAPQDGNPQIGPDGIVYPGTCRNTPRPAQMPMDTALRLNMREAAQRSVIFEETGSLHSGISQTSPDDMVTQVGDIVLSRRGMGTSYHLAVTVDDATQNVTDVIRGADLFEATRIHVLLQTLLGLPTPRYHHHALIRDDAGKRLAKRDDARAIAKYRADGLSPADIRQRVGL